MKLYVYIYICKLTSLKFKHFLISLNFYFFISMFKMSISATVYCGLLMILLFSLFNLPTSFIRDWPIFIVCLLLPMRFVPLIIFLFLVIAISFST